METTFKLLIGVCILQTLGLTGYSAFMAWPTFVEFILTPAGGLTLLGCMLSGAGAAGVIHGLRLKQRRQNYMVEK